MESCSGKTTHSCQLAGGGSAVHKREHGRFLGLLSRQLGDHPWVSTTYTSNIGNGPGIDDGRTAERESEEIVSNKSERLLSILPRFSNIHHGTSSQGEATLYDKHGGLDLESSGGVRSSKNRDGLNSTKRDVEEGTILGRKAKAFDQGGTKCVCTIGQL
jgi:hypothetical protein